MIWITRLLDSCSLECATAELALMAETEASTCDAEIGRVLLIGGGDGMIQLMTMMPQATTSKLMGGAHPEARLKQPRSYTAGTESIITYMYL